jgi:hypothetical protein
MSPNTPVPPLAPGPAEKTDARSGIHWVWRILYILYSIEVGLFLILLPWLAIWDNNYLLYRFPNFRPIVGNSYLKGAVLGLGIVNVVIGIQEIVSFRKGTGGLFSRD